MGLLTKTFKRIITYIGLIKDKETKNILKIKKKYGKIIAIGERKNENYEL